MNEYYGGCHCGAVSFKFQSQEKVEIWKCNCSICNAYDYEHLFIKHEDLTVMWRQQMDRRSIRRGGSDWHQSHDEGNVRPLGGGGSHSDGGGAERPEGAVLAPATHTVTATENMLLKVATPL